MKKLISICDICEERESSRRYTVHRSIRGCFQKFRGGGGMYQDDLWTPKEKIEICEVCAKKIFQVKRICGRKIPGHKE